MKKPLSYTFEKLYSLPPPIVHKITPLNMQHPNCQCEFEDFKESLTASRCDVCFILDGRHCLGGCHKRHRIPVEGDLFHDAVNFISHGIAKNPRFQDTNSLVEPHVHSSNKADGAVKEEPSLHKYTKSLFSLSPMSRGTMTFPTHDN